MAAESAAPSAAPADGRRPLRFKALPPAPPQGRSPAPPPKAGRNEAGDHGSHGRETGSGRTAVAQQDQRHQEGLAKLPPFGRHAKTVQERQRRRLGRHRPSLGQKAIPHLGIDLPAQRIDQNDQPVGARERDGPLALFGPQRQPHLERRRLQMNLVAGEQHEGPEPDRGARRPGIAGRLRAGERVPGRGALPVAGGEQRPPGRVAEPDVLRLGGDGPYHVRERARRRPVGALGLGKEESGRQQLRPQGRRRLGFDRLEHERAAERRLQRFDLRQSIGQFLRREGHFPVEGAQGPDGERASRLGAFRRQQPGSGQTFRGADDRRKQIRRRLRHRLGGDRQLRQPPGGDTERSRVGPAVRDRFRQPGHGVDRVVEGLIGRGIGLQQEFEAERRGLDQPGMCLAENAHPAPVAIPGPCPAQHPLTGRGVVERREPAVVGDSGNGVRSAGRAGRLEESDGGVARAHGGETLDPRQRQGAGLAGTRGRLCRRGEQRERQPPHDRRRRCGRQARQQGFDPRPARAGPDIAGEPRDPCEKHAGGVGVDGVEGTDLDPVLARLGDGQHGNVVWPDFDDRLRAGGCGAGLARLRTVAGGFVRLRRYQPQRLVGVLSDALTRRRNEDQHDRDGDAGGSGQRVSAGRRTRDERSRHGATGRRSHFSKRSLDSTFSIWPLGGGMSQVRRNPIPPPMTSRRMTTRTFKGTCPHSWMQASRESARRHVSLVC